MAEYTKKSKNLIVVPASENYLPGLTALLNSIEYHKIDADVLLVSFRLPENYLERIQEAFDFQINIVKTDEGESQVLQTAIERFKYAVEYGKQYDSICILDADMYFMANVDVYFQIASKGFIITSHNGMIVNFNKEYQKKYGVDLGSKEYPYLKIHCTVPTWVGPQDLDWFDRLYNSKRIDDFDDLLFLNVLGIAMGKDKRMISLQAFQTTNIHHFCVKPVTGIIRKGNLITSGVEGEMLSMHGKWWDEPYYKDIATTMERYFKDEMLGNRQKEQMLNSREIVIFME